MKFNWISVIFISILTATPGLWAQSWRVENFESKSRGLGDYVGLYGPALVSITWFDDPTGQSLGVMRMLCNAVDGTKAAFGTDAINVIVEGDTATAWTMDVWIPKNFPSDGLVQIFGISKSNPKPVYTTYTLDKLVPGNWNTLTFDIMKHVRTNDDYDLSGGLTIGVEFVFKYGSTWAGYVYGDNVTLVGVIDPMANFQLQPPVISVQHIQDQTSPYDNSDIIYHNKITWSDLANGGTEKYHLYASKSNPVTDINASDVIKLSPANGFDRGVQIFRHWINSVDGKLDQHWYYAITAVGYDPERQEILETEPAGSATTGPITSSSAKSHVIPYIRTFQFNPDGNLDEFIQISKQFSGSVLRTEVAEGPAAEQWSTTSGDANFTLYMIMDKFHIYVGAEVFDDNPDGIGDVWKGDAIDLFIGFFNPENITEYYTQPKLEVGYAINAPTPEERIQVNGFQKNKISDVEHYLVKFQNGYVVEMKIPFYTIATASAFVPYHGAFIPLRVTVNDNDGVEDYGGGRSLMLTHGGGNTENWNAELLPQTWRWHYISDVPDQNTAVAEKTLELPAETKLLGNYPNPFNPSTTISYELAKDELVSIVIFDTRGREIKNVLNHFEKAGEHKIQWHGTNNSGHQVSTGVYFVHFRAGLTHSVQKILFAK